MRSPPLIPICTMKKSYFITIGSVQRTPLSYAEELTAKLDLDFEQHDSFYKGIYFKYEGLLCDSLIVQSNKVGDDFQYPKFPDYLTIITASFVSGTEKDKKAKHKHLLRIFEKMEHTEILQNEYLDEEGRLNECV